MDSNSDTKKKQPPQFSAEKVADIQVKDGRRPVDGDRVKALMTSIEQVGLLHPIGVTTDLHLIHGRHRLEACRALGWGWIPVMRHDLDDMHRELAELDENLVRSNLTKIEEVKALARRKELYEALHPETKHGATGRKGRNKEEKISSFSDDTAAKTGRTARSVRGDVALANALPDEVVRRIANTSIANNKSELKKLAALDTADQYQAATWFECEAQLHPLDGPKGVDDWLAQRKPKSDAPADTPDDSNLDTLADSFDLDAPDGEPSSSRETASHSSAMDRAAAAIKELGRIRRDNPHRVEALLDVRKWIQHELGSDVTVGVMVADMEAQQ